MPPIWGGQLDSHRTSYQKFDWHAAARYVTKKCLQDNIFISEYLEPMKRITNLFNEDATFTNAQTKEYQGTTTRLFNAGLLGIVGKTKTQLHLYDNVYREIEINHYCINPQWKDILTQALRNIQADLKQKCADAEYELRLIEDKRDTYCSIQI